MLDLNFNYNVANKNKKANFISICNTHISLTLVFDKTTKQEKQLLQTWKLCKKKQGTSY